MPCLRSAWARLTAIRGGQSAGGFGWPLQAKLDDGVLEARLFSRRAPFVIDCIAKSPDAKTSQRDLGDAWKEWCRAGGILRAMSTCHLYRRLEVEHGFPTLPTGRVRSLSGVTLIDRERASSV